MAFDSRFHALFFGYLLVLGVINLAPAVLGHSSLAQELLGIVYVAIATHQLFNGHRSAPAIPAVQRLF